MLAVIPRQARAAPPATDRTEVVQEAQALQQQASALQQQGDLRRAIALTSRAVQMLESTRGAERLQLVLALSKLATLQQAAGDWEQAETQLKRVHQVFQTLLGPEHPSLAASLNNLAAFHRDRGDYAQAMAFAQQAVDLVERKLGPDHKRIANLLNTLATLHYEQGNRARALALYQRALAIQERSLGRDHPDVAGTLNNLAMLRQDQGELAPARELFERALAIKEQALGANHPDVAIALHNLAELHRDLGELDRAVSLLERALAIKEETLGRGHARVATTLNSLAVLRHEQRRYDEADRLLQRALTLRRRALGPNHPKLATVLFNQARLRLAQGRVDDTVRLLERVAELDEQKLQAVLATGAAEQKRSMFEDLRKITGVTLSVHAQFASSSPRALRLALTTVLRRKGRVLDAASDTLHTLRRSADPAVRAQLDELRASRAELATLLLRGPGQQDLGQHQAKTAELEAAVATLEEQLGRRYAKLRVERAPVTIEGVQAALDTHSALVELVVYRPWNPTARSKKEARGPKRYAAYVLHPRGAPRWIDLGPAKAIDERVRRARQMLGLGGLGYAKLARQLDELVMRPIRALLGNTRDLYVSPDGELNLLPLAALVDEHDRFLLSRLRITYLSSGRDLLRQQHRAEPRQGPLVLAAPSYGTSADVSGQPMAPPGARAGTGAGLRFSPLPHTAREGRALARLMTDATVLTAAEASEAVLKQARGPRLLHIATHGFFFDGRSAPAGPHGRRGLELLPSSGRPAPTLQARGPLLRSGLALAGANHGAQGGEDGILTALEMAQLDLNGTQLVVLSACETALGQVEQGEGVYGMRRALVLAGAQTQMMSLWKVDDAMTSQLMVGYYRRLLKGDGRSNALREAQLEMLARPDSAHPIHWAAFIVAGDARTLDGRSPPPPRQIEHGSATSTLLTVKPAARGCGCALPGTPVPNEPARWPLWLAAAALGRRGRRACTTTS